MFQGLQKKWKVSGGRLILIIVTFAIGGSLCGYAGRKILALTNIDKGFFWILLYILLITIIWPLAVIIISIPLGQYKFFQNYLRRVGRKMRGKAKDNNQKIINIAIFASGTGTNADNIINKLPLFFQNNQQIKPNIAVIVTENPLAGVLNVAKKYGVPSELIDLKKKSAQERAVLYLAVLEKYRIDFIVLAGYLKMIPPEVINKYRGRIVNIHPALLPAYGGAGMYGSPVHEAVIIAGEKKSGISIHHVDEVYDNGKIILQADCDIEPGETAASLAKKIHALEHEHYPAVIAKMLNK